MPHFGNLIAGLGVLRAELNSTRDVARSCAEGIRASTAEAVSSATSMATDVRRHTDEVQSHVGARVDDLLFDLERMSQQGNVWATSLIDIVQQVKAGTVDAGKAIGSMGDGMILFEGKLQSIRQVLLDVLPTTGQVQQRIVDLRAELEHADVSELVDRLRGQYNQYAQLLADTVEGFTQGRVTLERVLQVAQELQKVLPGSETAATADALAEAIQDALQSGTL